MDQIPGIAMILSVAVWASVHCSQVFVKALRSRGATDSTASPVTADQSPGIYWMTLVGLAILITASAGIAVACVVAILMKIAGTW